MDPDHNIPPVPIGQSSHPHAQQEPSPLISSQRVDNGVHSQTQSAATPKPLLSSPEGYSPAGDPDAGIDPVPQPPPEASGRDGHMLRGPLQHPYIGPPVGNPDAGIEPVPQPPPAARGRDGHTLRRPLQHSYMGTLAGGPGASFEPVPQPPPAARGRDGNMLRGPLEYPYMSHARSISSDVGWSVSEVGEVPQRRKIRQRLARTIKDAKKEKTRYEIKARRMGWALNIAMGLQVLLGALTTGISAASSSKQTSIGISILGGASTLVASYLARKRGSNEPHTSKTLVKDLEQFLRDCYAFEMDHGEEYGTPGDRLNARLKHLRRRFEEILGNADVQEKPSSPV